MAELFGTTADSISLHLKNVYASEELEEIATTEDFSVVRQEGAREVTRNIDHYNLDVIISVGYRGGVQFRQWATRTLKSHWLSKQIQNSKMSKIDNYGYNTPI